MTMKVKTNFVFAEESPDFLEPVGAFYDDTTDQKYIESIEDYFSEKEGGDRRPLTTLELGCAGGRIVKDLVERGHDSYGLEGAPYPLFMARPAWLEYYNTRIFNCDISKPFKLLEDDGTLKTFDVISHWEFLEHLSPSCLDYFHARLWTHLKPDGSIFCGVSPWGPSLNRDRIDEGSPLKTHALDVKHHQSCFWEDEWEKLYWNQYFNVHEYPLEGKLRKDWDEELNLGSFYIHLTRKNDDKQHKLANETITKYEKKYENKMGHKKEDLMVGYEAFRLGFKN